MIKLTYFNQDDPRWNNIVYPAPGYEDATIGSAGCGPTCMSMVVYSTKDNSMLPPKMCDWSKTNGYRVSGGTSDAIVQGVANNWKYDYRQVKSTPETFDMLNEGYVVAIVVGSGLWTSNGHWILAAYRRGDDIGFIDPYYYDGKYSYDSRKGANARVENGGEIIWVNKDLAKQYGNHQRFYALKISDSQNYDGSSSPAIPTDVRDAWINTESKPLNIRSGPGTNYSIVGSLPKGTEIDVYDVYTGWAHIGNGQYVSEEYITYVKPSIEKIGIVNTNSAPLNVRSGPGTNYRVVKTLPKGTRVTTYETLNGWIKIDGGYVSASYIIFDNSNSTVGQTRKFKGNTTIYSNGNLTGTIYNYLPNTKITILENYSGSVDKIKVLQTGRIGYVNTNVYA